MRDSFDTLKNLIDQAYRSRTGTASYKALLGCASIDVEFNGGLAFIHHCAPGKKPQEITTSQAIALIEETDTLLEERASK
ncbi:hypothetical protein [Marinobacterium stanieri]|uniref:Uncharacterized protein n=1 Tax=Marinobacterium stanieri TaxID=49186 RepID=A0A1N6QCU8_9GAMM|nr:hypothetical protein [Marinobacterium stanieri]SIQ14431.1 hypothetical protein SAMN05421647_102424 [Marinobacterium stanieri]